MSVTVILRRALLMVSALVATAALGACGSGGTTTTNAAATSTTSGSFGARRAALITCLRQHGVTLPSRPRTTTTPPPGGFRRGGGFLFRNAASNPKLRAALRACGGSLRFRGGPGAFRLSHARINSFVACIREHGYPQMPNPNFSGKGPVFPPTIRSNPKFQAASRVCQSTLVPSGPPPTSSTTANS